MGIPAMRFPLCTGPASWRGFFFRRRRPSLRQPMSLRRIGGDIAIVPQYYLDRGRRIGSQRIGRFIISRADERLHWNDFNANGPARCGSRCGRLSRVDGRYA
jgi:hypothetical protein